MEEEEGKDPFAEFSKFEVKPAAKPKNDPFAEFEKFEVKEKPSNDFVANPSLQSGQDPFAPNAPKQTKPVGVLMSDKGPTSTPQTMEQTKMGFFQPPVMATKPVAPKSIEEQTMQGVVTPVKADQVEDLNRENQAIKNKKRTIVNEFADFASTLGHGFDDMLTRIAAAETQAGAWQRKMFLMPMGGEKYEKAVAKEKEVNKKIISYLDYVEREAADRGEKLNIATSIYDVVKNGELNRLPQAVGYTIGNTALQALPTAFTGGYTMFADSYTGAYKKGVEDLAKRLNITPDQVIEKGLDAKLIPVISASIQSALEKVSLGIISKSIASTGGYAAVRNWLIKNIGNTKWGKFIGDLGALAVTGGKESATEVAQETAAVVGEIGAKSRSLKDFMQQLPEVVTSKENQKRYIESAVGGAAGGVGLTLGGKALNAGLNSAARAMAPKPSAVPPPTQPPPAAPKPGEVPPSGASKKSTVTTVKAPEGDTYYENVTDEEFEAYKKGQIDADRLAGITDDANIALRNPNYLLELQDDPHYHMMVVDKMHELHEEKKSRDISDDELAQFQQTRVITPERIKVIQNDIAQGKDLEDFDPNYQELVKGYLEEQAKSLNPEADDSQNITGVSGEVGGGQAVVEAQPIEGAGAAPIEAGGVVQAQGEQIIPPGEEAIIPGQTAPPQAGAVAPEAGVPPLTAEQEAAAPKTGVAPEAQVPVVERQNDLLKENFNQAGEQSKNNKSPKALGNFIIDNAQVGDRIKVNKDEYYEVVNRKTNKKGHTEIELQHFFRNEDTGVFENNPAAVKLFTDKYRGTDQEKQGYSDASDLFENVYTNSKGERVVERATYEPAAAAPVATPTPTEQKPTPRVQEFLGKKTNVYDNYVPSPENVEPDAVYNFTADSKEGLPELLQDRAQRASKITTEVGGKKVIKERWTATIPGDELGKIYEQQNGKVQGASQKARKEGGPQATEQGVSKPEKTKGIIAKARQAIAPGNEMAAALQVLLESKISPAMLQSIFGGPDKQTKTGRKNIQGELQSRIGYLSKTGISSTGRLGEMVAQKLSDWTNGAKEANEFDSGALESVAIQAIMEHKSHASMAKEIIRMTGEEEADMMRYYDPEAVYEEDYNEDLANEAEDIVNDLTDAQIEEMYSMSNADFDKMVAMFAEEKGTVEQKEAGKILSEAQKKLDKAKEALAEEKKKQSKGSQQELFGRTPLGFAQNVSPKALEEKITQLQTAVNLAQREVDKAKKLVESEEGKETRQAKMEFEKSVFSDLDAAMELSGQQSADARKAFQEKHGKEVYDNAKKITKEFEGIVNYLKDQGKLTSPCL